MTRIASVQMVSTPRLEQNLQTAAQLTQQACQAGAELVVLPEFFCLMGHSDQDKLTIAETEGQGPIQLFLQQLAQQHGIYLIAGSIPIRSNVPNKVFNTCLVYNPNGQQIQRYDKVHLFSFKGIYEQYDEGKTLQTGQPQIKTVQCGAIQVGLSICYDLRFPEFFRAMVPVDLFVVPSAFTYTTGKAHWELLLRARAVENQCYVLGSNQGGLHENGRQTWGHSMIVDPWGEVLVCLEKGQGFVVESVDAKRLQMIRERLPALKHRVFK